MNCLFEVYKNAKYHKSLSFYGLAKKIKVFAIRDDKKGYPHFLIYEDGEWKYKSAKLYIPINSDT